MDCESRTLGLDRNELGGFLVQAGLGSPRDHALASLLALNGLRISEALGADIDDLDFERGHRTLMIVRKGGKHVTIPLAPRTSRAIDRYIGERTTGPIFLGAKGGRMDRYAADRTVKRLAHKSRRPIVLDQPEENLDNQTVHELLVPAIAEARKSRQVIAVTHNPNLAVVGDADQVIVAEMTAEQFPYVSGAIEDPEINGRIVQIFEGTWPAFQNRRDKYTPTSVLDQRG